MKRKDVMLTLIFKCDENATVAECAQLMRDEQLGFVPILAGDKAVIGVVTDRDIAVRVVAEGRGFATPVKAIRCAHGEAAQGSHPPRVGVDHPAVARRPTRRRRFATPLPNPLPLGGEGVSGGGARCRLRAAAAARAAA